MQPQQIKLFHRQTASIQVLGPKPTQTQQAEYIVTKCSISCHFPALQNQSEWRDICSARLRCQFVGNFVQITNQSLHKGLTSRAESEEISAKAVKGSRNSPVLFFSVKHPFSCNNTEAEVSNFPFLVSGNSFLIRSIRKIKTKLLIRVRRRGLGLKRRHQYQRRQLQEWVSDDVAQFYQWHQGAWV